MGDDLELWALQEGEYVFMAGMFKVTDDRKLALVKRKDVDIQVTSKAEARYYFNQMTDILRRVTKLGKAAGSLF